MPSIVFPDPNVTNPFTDLNGDIWDYNFPKTRWARRPAPLGTAANYDVGTTSGKIPTIGAGDKLPASIIPSIAITEGVAVANTAARLDLTLADAAGKAVKEADTGKSYMLVANGVPSVSGDWILLGDGAITSADISDASTGGNGAADEGKVAEFGATGQLKATSYIQVAKNVIDGGVAQFRANNIPDSGAVALEAPTTGGTLAVTQNTDGGITVSDISDAGTLASQDGTFSGASNGTNTGDETATRIGTLINAATAKTTPVDADLIGIADSAASYVLKKLTFSNLWAWVKSKIESAAVDFIAGNYTESVVAIGNSGTSKTISLTSGTVQTCTLTGNCVFTMPTATAGKSFVLYLNTGAGSFTGTFTGVKWAGASAPTITTTASRMDILSFVADGTNWYGSIIQNFTP